MTDKEELIKNIKECKDVEEPRIINGYYVRTIVKQCFFRNEIVLKILAVFKDENDKEILQYNIDVENLFGGLLHSTCIKSNEIEGLAEEFLKNIKIITKEK